MNNMSRIAKRGSIYDCDGPFHFEAYSDEDDDWDEDDWDWDIEEDEEDWEDE